MSGREKKELDNEIRNKERYIYIKERDKNMIKKMDIQKY